MASNLTIAPVKVVVVRFKSVPGSPPLTYDALSGWIEPISNFEGFLSKTWINKNGGAELGGVYYFKDGASAQKYVEWLTPQLSSNPAYTDVQADVFDVFTELSVVHKSPHILKA